MGEGGGEGGKRVGEEQRLERGRTFGREEEEGGGKAPPFFSLSLSFSFSFSFALSLDINVGDCG